MIVHRPCKRGSGEMKFYAEKYIKFEYGTRDISAWKYVTEMYTENLKKK